MQRRFIIVMEINIMLSVMCQKLRGMHLLAGWIKNVETRKQQSEVLEMNLPISIRLEIKIKRIH